MNKQLSAPLIRTARLLDLVPYIHAHQGISMKALSEQFDVTQKQMISDLTTLWMCGLPGYTPLELIDLDFDSGYVSISNAETLSKPRAITFEEAIALILGLDLLKSSLSNMRVDLISNIESLAKRISNFIGVSLDKNLPSDTSYSNLLEIRTAISNEMALLIKYHAIYNDEITEREIVPIELYESENVYYLRSFCNKVSDFRTFRVDRILQMQSTLQKFAPTSSDSQTKKIEYEISIANPSRLAMEIFSISSDRKSDTYQLSSFSKEWIIRSVIASGVEVVTPTGIRREVAISAALILQRYKNLG